MITGGSGLLALNWACAVRADWDVILGTHTHSVQLAGTESCVLDLNEPVRLERQLGELAPDLVVHTAGLTNVEQCEAEPTLARRVNSEIARNVAIAASRRDVMLIHISTDHLFAGERCLYEEDAPPEPLNEYGRSKLLAETWVQQTYPRALIVRTNFFGWGHEGRRSFTDWIIYSLRAGNSLPLFDDIFITPILADTLALAAHELAELGSSGIFNVVGDLRLSKYEFAQRVVDQFGLSSELIQRESVARASFTARRPRDMSLSNSRVLRRLGRGLGGVDEHLASLQTQELEGRRHELLHSIRG